MNHLRTWLGDCGVVLVNELPLRSSKIDGASMLLDNGTPVIGLTTRNDRVDTYIYTLLHELAHLILGHLQDCDGVCLDENLEVSQGKDSTEIEGEANELAANWILPPDFTIPSEPVTMARVIELVQQYDVPASLVIGRIQYETKNWSLLRRSIWRVRPFLDECRMEG
jgi:HTH-type transcriptional regulator/antitoxin HigA